METLKRWLPAIPASQERWCISILSAVAALHVFIFSAAFPFFNVDEMYHFDLVVRYSHVNLPRKADYVSDEAMRYIVVFSTWEYTRTNDTLNAPPWKQPMSEMQPILLSREVRWRGLVNYEVTQAPLYYLLAGSCWQLGQALSFHDGFLLYLLHFANMLVAGVLVWIGWFATRNVFPDNLFVRIAVPALVAFMPDRTFYSVNNDLLSPLCFGAAFVGMIHFLREDVPSRRVAAATGLAMAATFLAKSSNLPRLAVSATAIMLKIWMLFRQKNLSSTLPPLLVMFFCAVLPISVWIVWCKIYFGDLIGSSDVARKMGWTVKPISEWWHHPIFAPRGFWTFLSGNLDTFWQGEMLWHKKPLYLWPVNLLYAVGSLILIAAAVLCLKRVEAFQRRVLLFAFAGLIAEFAFYGLLPLARNAVFRFWPPHPRRAHSLSVVVRVWA